MTKRNIAKSIAAFIVFSVMTSSAVAQQVPATSGDYTLLTETLHSAVLNENRTITVQLPKSYASTPNKKYPVIYRLDGKGNIPLITAVLEKLQEASAAPEVIIVAIENTDRQRDLFPTVNQEPQGPIGIGGGAPKFLTFIENELIPFVNNKYRTHNYKVIAGASAGGVFVLYALQTKPELFQAHLAYSAAVWWNHGATAESTKAFMANTKTLDNYLYMNIGEESGFMRQRYDDLHSFIASNTPNGLTFISDEFDTVPHGLTSVAGIFNAYHNLFLPLRMPLRAFTGDTQSIVDYYNRLSQQYGEQTSPPEWLVRELGYHFVNSGNLEQAITLFKYGITLYPDKPDAYNGLAYGYEQGERYEESLAQVNKALALSAQGYDGYDVYLARKERLLKLLAQ
ncbi:alpha/beta hydrolase-fold protein [Rheinheimera maricola]|uniref:Prolyl oligopeptidase family serine peptidase n=1 Tax=Rheinheimera maricola TaxID=2793282 RepID=A0ABS7XAJ0_9GAMM|nr:alpha/beta hydrolase-fold protein [Rheinheimera maricola]MBZ9611802.1 prolyl oligopeptidase family serine peptidase [Rheinheimera maricola]